MRDADEYDACVISSMIAGRVGVSTIGLRSSIIVAGCILNLKVMFETGCQEDKLC